MIKDVIWDFDGTLFNTYPAIAGVFLESLGSFGVSEDRRNVLKMLHQSLSDTYDYFSSKHSLPREDLRSEFVKNEESMDVSAVSPFEGAADLLETVLNKGGVNLVYTNRGPSTYSFLEHAGYMKYFSEIITREDGFGRKPKPDCINYFLSKYSLNKSSTLMVGDRIIDVLAAQNAGIKSCYFNSHHIPIDITPDIYIDSLPELLPYLK
ncbi:MAG: HAD-IA family hydrolase [Clostridia bacterium]|nr:HAD-IA family hydrolase [Clostridia bacterium]